MTVRYTDSAAHRENVSPDFTPRRRKPSLLGLLLLFIAAISLSVTLPVLILDKMVLVFWLFLLLSGAGWYVIVSLAQSRDIILATEFQNALFASALGHSNKFCLIIKHDGNIVYMDKGFQNMFPALVKERNISIVGMMKHGRVGMVDKDKIYAAIDHGVYDKIIIDIYDHERKVHKVVMSLEPIVRPSGFLLLRARDYIDQRARGEGDPTQLQMIAANNLLLTKSGLNLFFHTMAMMNTGICITNTEGSIVQTNTLFDQWLAYREFEVTNAHLTWKEIIGQGVSASDNFEGECTLKTKNGAEVKVFINQKMIRDDNQVPLGRIILVNKLVEKERSATTSLW